MFNSLHTLKVEMKLLSHSFLSWILVRCTYGIPMLKILMKYILREVVHLCKCAVLPRLQGRRNATQSEGVSETSISSRVKTNLSTMGFYADLCFPRPGKSFSV